MGSELVALVQEGNEFHNSAVLMKKISYNNPDCVHCATQFYAMTLNACQSIKNTFFTFDYLVKANHKVSFSV